MWIPDEMKKCVAFLCIKNKEGVITPGGTGFFISVASKTNSNRIYTYFVTARHNIIAIGQKDFWLRINSKDGKLLELPGNSNVKWFYNPNHEQNPADVALMRFPIFENKIDALAVPPPMYEKTEELINSGELGIGNEVFITGLFTRLSGKQENLPIIRMGNIAMIPNEKVPTKDFGNMDAYLIEARSIGGVSGSPVFFCKPQQTNKGFIPGVEFYLGGLIHGHWDTLEENIDSFLATEDAKESKNINMGIAIVTPIAKIIETLNCEELMQERVENDKLMEKGNTPIAD
ncbi:MAG: hypothetical protein KGI58_02145 [Patescibacteria group bacterium]|nr:hypothetical protein [Patescibacteria group bacterium]